MIKFNLILFLVACCYMSQGQNINFTKNDDSKKVKKGTVVTITSDSAYVISGGRAQILNDKIAELETIRNLYNDMVDNRNTLLKEIKGTQELVEKLYVKMQADSVLVGSQFDNIIADLSHSLENLKSNNSTLKTNNKALQDETDKLRRIVDDLRKETRHIWWDGLTDKIVSFAGGLGVGVLIMLLL